MAQTKVNWKNDDPMSSRMESYDAQKGFKGSKAPKQPFKNGKVREETESDYMPFKGKERK